jgi:para-aminobenzoate synthetase component 1
MRHRLLEASVAGWIDPAAAFSALVADEPRAVWLDGNGVGTSYLAVGTRLATASVIDGTVTVDGVTSLGSILDVVRSAAPVGEQGSAGGFRGGWVGWLGYELRGQTMGVAVRHPSARPDAAMLWVERFVAFDHAAGTVTLCALGDSWDAGLAEWREATLARLAGAQVPDLPQPATATATWATTDADYLGMIAECQRAIHEGEAYQLCLTTEASVPVHPDAATAYLRLRAVSPSHHGAYFRIDDLALLSASPEQFLTVGTDGIVESRPIKGTRPRGADAASDAALAAELLASEKERAENLMIVDLVRNDIARVSEVGSVSVPSLLAVESYPQVHQLVSTVRGRLAAGLDGVDAVAACFPAGSMTGAPKHRAVELLDALEGRPRGLYSGVFGYFGVDGRIDLAMVIRSIVLDAHGATVGAGGGITALSVPEEELAEVKLKAAALLAVLGARER